MSKLLERLAFPLALGVMVGVSVSLTHVPQYRLTAADKGALLERQAQAAIETS